MAVHATVLVLILFVVYSAYPFNTLFSWHPLFMIVGLYGFSLQGIVVYNTFSSLVPTHSAVKKYHLHALLQTLSIITILAGSTVIYKVKNNNNRPHLKSWHGTLGALFVLYGLSQGIFGFLKSRDFTRRWVRPKLSRKVHAVSGALFFSLGCLVTGLGFRSEWFQQRVLVNSIQDQGVRMLVDYALIFLLCLLVIVVSKQIYDRYFTLQEISVTTTSTHAKSTKSAK
ncbi:unnamed protein product [Hymenolepis diminuta]|uniref:ascorbate ferrireductase (transmembrane) n=1 Tax=Hymenolepis diminuta TaxID=6216 RepID=A0A0R3SA49_HYMDI|nr:unnamed protein product [Hymenolepis diminuta]VUZ41247.1 unnamed protein product [Hymenolepis diminuta]